MSMTLDQLRDLRDAIDAHLNGKPVEYSSDAGKTWLLCESPGWAANFYYFRPKRGPVTRPWNCPADVPMPVCWVRSMDFYGKDFFTLVISVTEEGIYMPSLYPWANLAEAGRYQYSTDGRDWRPLTVEVRP